MFNFNRKIIFYNLLNFLNTFLIFLAFNIIKYLWIKNKWIMEFTFLLNFFVLLFF